MLGLPISNSMRGQWGVELLHRKLGTDGEGLYTEKVQGISIAVSRCRGREIPLGEMEVLIYYCQSDQVHPSFQVRGGYDSSLKGRAQPYRRVQEE